jgi:predicted SAM-dependent methyltransferase
MILDIGCGEDKKGDVGVDIRKISSIDILADARMLPLRDAAFEHVYSSHLIEHFSHREVRSVLVEWVRVLRKHGTIEIRCPELRARAFLFFINPTWKNMKDIYGAQDYIGNNHRCGFSLGLLKHLLESCGIGDVKRIIRGYKGIPFLPDSLHVKGVKR